MTGSNSGTLARARVASFRDPAGALLDLDGRLLRRVSAAHSGVLTQFLNSATARSLFETGRLIDTRVLANSDLDRESLEGLVERTDTVLEHERVWFPSYPYEWPAEMLLATGRLTLELSQTASSEGFGLKDATPYNVLFRGPQAVFVDLLSFERRDPGDPTWLPYAQFQRMFLLPLLMHQRFGTSLSELFLQQRDGIEPEQVYPYTTWPQRLRAPFLTAVSVPTWLRNRAQKRGPALYRPKQVDPEKAAFILKSQLERLGRQLAKLTKSQSGESTWSSYMQTLSYTDAEFESKTATVTQWVAELRPGSLLDIGCNTGHFSEIAARLGARVVAIDADPAVVGSTWKRATANQLDILPLVVNIARPTPAMGWRNSEYASFLERAAGRFDMVTLLAVIHHLMVTERVPLDEIVSLTAELTTGHAIVEYVSKDDPMFQLLTRGRAALHSNFTQEVFERSCGQRFTVIEKRQSKNGLRCLYLLAKRLS